MKLARSRTSGLSTVESSFSNISEQYIFYNRSEQFRNGYLEFQVRIFKNGSCGNMNVQPSKRSCTPYAHLHPYQLETFTVLQGQFAYQLGKEIHSCDNTTCPKPLVIHPNVIHTFWMNDNQDDLVIVVYISPIYADHGLTASSYENIAGTRRDQFMNLWQALVFIDTIESYPVFLPLNFVKIFFRIGSILGQLLGYQKEYDEYTTKFSKEN